MHVFATALAEVNSMDPDVLRPVVLTTEFDAPQGHIAIDTDSGHTSLFTRIGRARRDGRFEVVRESCRAVRPDPYLVAQ